MKSVGNLRTAHECRNLHTQDSVSFQQYSNKVLSAISTYIPSPYRVIIQVDNSTTIYDYIAESLIDTGMNNKMQEIVLPPELIIVNSYSLQINKDCNAS